jgi:hypothetical protein
MRRIGLIAILALAVAPAVARADFKTGRYAFSQGATSRCDVCSISFKASKTKVSKLAFKVNTAKSACTNGDRLGDESSDYKAASGLIEKRKFSITLTDQTANGVYKARVKGKLSGTKASGTLQSVFKFTSGLTCDTGALKWKAAKS